MTSVGETLRREREKQDRAMAEIAEELCITQRYLRAIEEDDLKSLPGTFFYKSFVKQYAALLDLDPNKLRTGVERLTAAEEPEPVPGVEPPGAVRMPDQIVQAANSYFSNRRIGFSLVALAGVLLACSGFYAWWNNAARGHSVTEAGAPAPVKLPAPMQPGAVQQPTIKVTTAPGISVTATPEADGVNRVVLNLSATEKTWLSIVSDGRQIFAGILEPAQTKTLRSIDTAKLKIGNAGGLDVMLNGKPIPPIGPRGQVREVLFTPDSYQVLKPPVPSTTL